MSPDRDGSFHQVWFLFVICVILHITCMVRPNFAVRHMNRHNFPNLLQASDSLHLSDLEGVSVWGRCTWV